MGCDRYIDIPVYLLKSVDEHIQILAIKKILANLYAFFLES